ncbi:MAG: preprotein translocase subunit SecE [Candidatus Aminicenantes bacterium]|jgi:preprotein translocase subunit SecE|nr:preprotein translocase subunit SecE [Candidatus Aminicenantes bacterium]
MNGKEKWYRRFVNFIKNVRAELKKVTWPSRSEVYSTTIVVILATVFFGFYLFLVDALSSWALTKVRAFLG